MSTRSEPKMEMPLRGFFASGMAASLGAILRTQCLSDPNNEASVWRSYGSLFLPFEAPGRFVTLVARNNTDTDKGQIGTLCEAVIQKRNQPIKVHTLSLDGHDFEDRCLNTIYAGMNSDNDWIQIRPAPLPTQLSFNGNEPEKHENEYLIGPFSYYMSRTANYELKL